MIDQLWAMDPIALEALLRDVPRHEAQFAAFMGSNLSDEVAAKTPLNVVDGVAKIDLRGAMVEDPPLFMRLFSRVAVPSEIIAQMEEAQARADVKKIEIVVDSPGGTVSAGAALAEYVAGWKGKPLLATCRTAASAAYWSVVSCDEIVASRTSMIGSIGCMLVVRDTSEAAAKEGVKVHLLRSGPHKGVPTGGVPITDGELAKLQTRVDAAAKLFTDAVAAARGDIPSEAFDGSVFFGDQALALGLIDRVTTMEAGMENKNEAATTAPVQEVANATAATPAAVEQTARVEALAAANDKLLAEQLQLQDELAALRDEQATWRAEALVNKAKADGVAERYFVEEEAASPLAELASGKCSDPIATFKWMSAKLAERAIVPPTVPSGGGDEDPVALDPQEAIRQRAKQLAAEDKQLPEDQQRFKGDYKAAVRAAREEVTP